MKQIPLRNKDGETIDWALVDDEDYEWLMCHRWYKMASSTTPYAYGYVGGGRKAKDVPMHRFIYEHHFGPIVGLLIDHKDRQGLNNQKTNLRTATQSQNQANRKKQCDALTSQYKGVTYVKGTGKWDARIGTRENQYCIKQFISEKDAALAYDMYAREKFGEFACTNFPSIDKEDEARIRCLINTHKKINTTAKYIGVYRESRYGRIIAYYTDSNHKSCYIGTFASEEEAARARDKIVVQLGLKRKLNFTYDT